jgi:hypothetical protein
MNEAGDILEGWIVQAFHLVQQPMVQKLAHLFKYGIHLPEITQKSGPDIGLTPQSHLDIEGVSVKAAILGRARAQMVGGVESEALGNLDHRVSGAKAA